MGQVEIVRRTDPTTTGEARFGGHGMWAPMIPIARDPDEWVCWVGDPDEGLDPVVVRSVD
ncbi:hypothetical protein CLV43_106397 [Umezawaea tangerina]|uniref:Uncharacterized protein n=1 Tax=Umezawaea tangerina TaxID=84725 RepID=A0A2T0T4Q5_9PSEU|nr:hypothetical protein CLV43_106397 [Umezawaea tangerina]